MNETFKNMKEDDPLFDTYNLYLRLREMISNIEAKDEPQFTKRAVERMAAFYRAHMDIFTKTPSKKTAVPLYVEREDEPIGHETSDFLNSSTISLSRTTAFNNSTPARAAFNTPPESSDFRANNRAASHRPF